MRGASRLIATVYQTRVKSQFPVRFDALLEIALPMLRTDHIGANVLGMVVGPMDRRFVSKCFPVGVFRVRPMLDRSVDRVMAALAVRWPRVKPSVGEFALPPFVLSSLVVCSDVLGVLVFPLPHVFGAVLLVAIAPSTHVPLPLCEVRPTPSL